MKLFLGKKGMEMWVLVLMVLAIILLLAAIVLYSSLGSSMKELLTKFGELF